MAIDLTPCAKSALWGIYNVSRLYLDMDYIANCLLEIINPDDILTEEVMDRLRHDRDYLDDIATTYNNIIMSEITGEDEINALRSAVKYRKLEDEAKNKEEK